MKGDRAVMKVSEPPAGAGGIALLCGLFLLVCGLAGNLFKNIESATKPLRFAKDDSCIERIRHF